MDFSNFDVRHYRTLPVVDGYREWAAHYESTVHDEMDLRLLERLRTVPWAETTSALDLACGTGRIGRWLRSQGARVIDGIDLTSEMLDQARTKDVYRSLRIGNVVDTHLPRSSYALVTQALADEHLPDLVPLYKEAARVATANGRFVLVGYHPFFLLNGIPTHFHRTADGVPLAIESHVHLLSDHVRAAAAAGWSLGEMVEGVVDEDWIAAKPKWEKHRGRPVSYAVVWERGR
jgi:SAM-dependent methyltransferase